MSICDISPLSAPSLSTLGKRAGSIDCDIKFSCLNSRGSIPSHVLWRPAQIVCGGERDRNGAGRLCKSPAKNQELFHPAMHYIEDPLHYGLRAMGAMTLVKTDSSVILFQALPR